MSSSSSIVPAASDSLLGLDPLLQSSTPEEQAPASRVLAALSSRTDHSSDEPSATELPASFETSGRPRPWGGEGHQESSPEPATASNDQASDAPSSACPSPPETHDASAPATLPLPGSIVSSGSDSDDNDDSDHSSSDPPLQGARLIQDWNQLALDLATSAARGPTISSRLYALVNTALYDAWAAFDAEAIGSIVDLAQPLGRPSEARTAAAMASAAHDVLLSIGASLFPGSVVPAALLTRADALLQQSFDLLPIGRRGERAASVARSIGQQVSSGIQTWAGLDGSNQAGNYADTTGYAPKPSVFDPTAASPTIDSTWQPLTNAATGVTQKALTPQWGQVSPFAIGSGAALVPNAILTPYDANGQLNPAFVAEVNQVLNLSMTLTPEQKAIAEFWEQGPGTSYPPGLWMAFTNQLIGSQGLGLDQAVKLSFGVSQALFDAGIAAWATKYTFDSVRPITAIRQLYAGQSVTDTGAPLSDWRGVPITGDLWQPYQNPNALTPNFPDVASGHSTYSTAAAGVLRFLLGSNSFNQSVTLADSASRFDPNGFDGVTGTGAPITLSWASFSQAAEQAGFSRLLGGIHFSDGNWQGQMIGAEVGALTNAKLDLLFNGNLDPSQPLAHLSQAASQLFGTMAADILQAIDPLTGAVGPAASATAPTPAASGVLELYGFAGDDLLIAGGSAAGRWDLFGGDGLDRFLIEAGATTLVRDYQVGETILFGAALLPAGSDLGAIEVISDPAGTAQAFTRLAFGGQTLVHLDGSWSRDQLTLALA